MRRSAAARTGRKAASCRSGWAATGQPMKIICRCCRPSVTRSAISARSAVRVSPSWCTTAPGSSCMRVSPRCSRWVSRPASRPTSCGKPCARASTGRRPLFDCLARNFMPSRYDDADFTLAHAEKDCRLALELAAEQSVPMQLAELAHREQAAAIERGWSAARCAGLDAAATGARRYRAARADGGTYRGNTGGLINRRLVEWAPRILHRGVQKS